MIICVKPLQNDNNCAENCYFTKNIARAMLKQIIIKNILFGVVFLIMAYFTCSILIISSLELLLNLFYKTCFVRL